MRVRVLVALALAVSLIAAPVTTVRACSCAGPAVDFIRQADFAFVGSVLRSSEPLLGMGASRYTFAVERARTPMANPFAVEIQDTSCSVDMNEGERWLVMASRPRGEGQALPQAGTCGSTPFDSLDADELAKVDEALTALPIGPADGFSIPGPIIIGALVLIGALASVYAFRHRAVS